MKTKQILFAVLAVFALIAAACGDDDDTTATEEPAAAPAEEPADEPEAEWDIDAALAADPNCADPVTGDALIIG